MSLIYNFTNILAQAKPNANQVESGFVYVIAAFTVVWLFIAAYLFWLSRRQDDLRREVDILRQEEAERQQSAAQKIEVGSQRRGEP